MCVCVGGGGVIILKSSHFFLRFLQTSFEEFLQGHTQCKTFSGLLIQENLWF